MKFVVQSANGKLFWQVKGFGGLWQTNEAKATKFDTREEAFPHAVDMGGTVEVATA
jgi:hypothetical protein